ncbi:MAG: TetR/AcrR family transcriptional regulator [Lachnospiraceae bacterium]|nr:TetR/AcrR family transcriptional regulator [Lachnospiraceae bacterium]
MRVVKNPDERKQEIVDAAIRVFARKGYEKTSISDIAKEIGISQGLCYRYFPSKEAVYDAGIDKYAAYIVRQNIQRTKLEGKTLKEQILLMSGKMGEYASAEKGQQELYELFHKEGNHKLHDQLYLRVGEKLIPFITEVLEQAKRRGETNISDPVATAYFFVYGQIGVLMSYEIPEAEKAKRIQDCLIELLGV